MTSTHDATSERARPHTESDPKGANLLSMSLRSMARFHHNEFADARSTQEMRSTHVPEGVTLNLLKTRCTCEWMSYVGGLQSGSVWGVWTTTNGAHRDESEGRGARPHRDDICPLGEANDSAVGRIWPTLRGHCPLQKPRHPNKRNGLGLASPITSRRVAPTKPSITKVGDREATLPKHGRYHTHTHVNGARRPSTHVVISAPTPKLTMSQGRSSHRHSETLVLEHG